MWIKIYLAKKNGEKDLTLRKTSSSFSVHRSSFIFVFNSPEERERGATEKRHSVWMDSFLQIERRRMKITIGFWFFFQRPSRRQIRGNLRFCSVISLFVISGLSPSLRRFWIARAADSGRKEFFVGPSSPFESAFGLRLRLVFDGTSRRKQVSARPEDRKRFVRGDLSRFATLSFFSIYLFSNWSSEFGIAFSDIVVHLWYSGTNIQTNEEVAIKLVSSCWSFWSLLNVLWHFNNLIHFLSRWC